MKKLVFLFAMVFAVSMVMAQNEAYINQITGAPASININQQGGENLIAGPSSVTDANGFAQDAALQIGAANSFFSFSQYGKGNTGLVRQESWLGTRAAELHWIQAGDDNIMMLNQKGKYDVEAKGKQLGDRNVFAGLNTVGFTYDANPIMVVDETQYAVQYDTDNDAFITSLQQGDDNKVGLYQYNGKNYTKFDLKQIGDNNTFTGYQYNEVASSNLMDVSQVGNGFVASVFQHNTIPGAGGNNFVSVQY